jgi:MYXO-CTERM domain-containing protein
MKHHLRLLVSVCLATASLSAAAEAHTLWMSPNPRDQMDGWKPGRSPGFMLPCGPARKAGQPMNTMKAGSMQMVTFKETVSHDGCFVIEFASSDAGPFQVLDTLVHPAAMKDNTVYTRMVQLPDMTCTDCILRVRQYMAKSTPCPPPSTPDMSALWYYSCANVTLTKDGASGSADGGSASADAGPSTGGSDASSAPGTGGSSGGSGGSSGAATGGSSGSTGGTYGTATGGSTGSTGGTTGSSGGSPDAAAPPTGTRGTAGGCSYAAGTAPAMAPLLVLAGLVLVSRRRRK